MKLSVANTFHPDLIPQLAQTPEVYEVYGKLDRDIIGGGRSTYTLRRINKSHLRSSIRQAHASGIEFNYLLNGASLGGMEQVRSGQRKIRAMLDWLSALKVDAVTVASPFLARIIKGQYPHFKIRASAFAMVDCAEKARQWEDLGVDTICVSAISCNRNFNALRKIREAVALDLQLIVNSSCLLNCAWEPTHMQLLTQSSRSGSGGSRFCLDYCVLNCSWKRLQDPTHFLRACWIRPEDLHRYEAEGYSNFKILERSCPVSLLIKRVRAYAKRSFRGNLFELVAPMASITKKLEAPLSSRVRLIFSMLQPQKIKLSSLLEIKRYMAEVIPADFSREKAPVYIDNDALDGFLEKVQRRDCGARGCGACTICQSFTQRAVTVEKAYRERMLSLSEKLNTSGIDGSLWSNRFPKQ